MQIPINKELSRDVLHMATPTITRLSSQMVVSITNTAMIGRLENAPIQLAAMGLGFLGSWAITSLFSSLSTGTHILVARRHGEGNHSSVGEVLNNSLFICSILGVVFGALGYLFSYQIIDFFSKNEAVTKAGA